MSIWNTKIKVPEYAPGIELPPVKGKYASCIAIQTMALLYRVQSVAWDPGSREGNLSVLVASKEAESPSNLFYVDSMWGGDCWTVWEGSSMYLQWVFLGERYEQGSLRLGKEELLAIKTRSL